VDWERVKSCLVVLHREARPFLSRALLIGGGACWFYRHLLERSADPDFPVPVSSPDDEARWLSKDLDFTGIFSADAEALMPGLMTRDSRGREYPAVGGVRLGFAQVGLTIDPEAARESCWVAQVGGPDGQPVEFFVADPVTLYREKLALTERRNAPADSLHLALLREFLRHEVCTRAAALVAGQSLSETKWTLNFLLLVQNRACEVLDDDRVRRRLGEALAVPWVNAADLALVRELASCRLS
jgi:hypothetical protein